MTGEESALDTVTSSTDKRSETENPPGTTYLLLYTKVGTNRLTEICRRACSLSGKVLSAPGASGFRVVLLQRWSPWEEIRSSLGYALMGLRT